MSIPVAGALEPMPVIREAPLPTASVGPRPIMSTPSITLGPRPTTGAQGITLGLRPIMDAQGNTLVPKPTMGAQGNKMGQGPTAAPYHEHAYWKDQIARQLEYIQNLAKQAIVRNSATAPQPQDPSLDQRLTLQPAGTQTPAVLQPVFRNHAALRPINNWRQPAAVRPDVPQWQPGPAYQIDRVARVANLNQLTHNPWYVRRAELCFPMSSRSRSN